VQAARFEWGKAIDPFSAFGLAPQVEVARLTAAPSLKMRRFLFGEMGTCPPSLSEADAIRLSKTIRARKRAGLADLKTVQWLSRHGISAQRMYQETADRVRTAIREKREWSQVEALVSGGRNVGAEG
jgi:hypothetical protein